MTCAMPCFRGSFRLVSRWWRVVFVYYTRIQHICVYCNIYISLLFCFVSLFFFFFFTIFPLGTRQNKLRSLATDIRYYTVIIITTILLLLYTVSFYDIRCALDPYGLSDFLHKSYELIACAREGGFFFRFFPSVFLCLCVYISVSN